MHVNTIPVPAGMSHTTLETSTAKRLHPVAATILANPGHFWGHIWFLSCFCLALPARASLALLPRWAKIPLLKKQAQISLAQAPRQPCPLIKQVFLSVPSVRRGEHWRNGARTKRTFSQFELFQVKLHVSVIPVPGNRAWRLQPCRRSEPPDAYLCLQVGRCQGLLVSLCFSWNHVIPGRFFSPFF